MNQPKEIRDKVLELRLKGLSQHAIAKEVGICRQSVQYILNKNEYDNNPIHKCWFCKSPKTSLSRIRNRNSGRECTMISVKCNNCHARGPKISNFDRDNIPIELTENKAISVWNELGVSL